MSGRNYPPGIFSGQKENPSFPELSFELGLKYHLVLIQRLDIASPSNRVLSTSTGIPREATTTDGLARYAQTSRNRI
jgi:hypothetical protein